jgi:enoyl-CoA hydratase/carnithine racemase
MEAKSERLRIGRHDDIVHIKFMRSLFDAEMVNNLYSLIGDLEEDRSLRGVVFHLGRIGSRLGLAGRLAPSIAQLGPSTGMNVFTHLEKALAALERLSRPTVAVLDGPIGSVGLELALVADLTIATPDTVFYVQGPEHGFLPGMSLYRLARHVGIGLAKRIMLHRTMVPAHQAQRFGIVDRIVKTPHRALRAELSHLLALPPATLNLARQMLYDAGPMTYQQAYESYKAAQFHSLHGLATAASPGVGREQQVFSAAEYVIEPISHWIDAAELACANQWTSLTAHAVRDGDTDAACILHRLDRAGIAGAVLYPSTVLGAYGCLSDKALSALLRRYNDWILELCAGAPERLRPAVLLDVDELETAAAEVRRTAAAGAAAAVIPLFPHNDQRYDNPRYEPLWSVLEQCEIPITLHRGTCHRVGNDPQPFDLTLHRLSGHDPLFDQVFDALEGSYARLAVVAMILSGVFARHPGLHVVTVGFGLSWAPYALLRLDEQYEVRPERSGEPDKLAGELGELFERHAFAIEGLGYHFPEEECPSDHFRRHVFVAVDDDPPGFELTDVFGARNILWAGQQRLLPGRGDLGSIGIRRVQGGLSTEERTTIERRNAVSLYGFLSDEELG